MTKDKDDSGKDFGDNSDETDKFRDNNLPSYDAPKIIDPYAPFRYFLTYDPLPDKDPVYWSPSMFEDTFLDLREATANIEPGEDLFEITVRRLPGLSTRVKAYYVEWNEDRTFSYRPTTTVRGDRESIRDYGYKVIIGPIIAINAARAIKEAGKILRRRKLKIDKPSPKSEDRFIDMLPPHEK